MQNKLSTQSLGDFYRKFPALLLIGVMSSLLIVPIISQNSHFETNHVKGFDTLINNPRSQSSHQPITLLEDSELMAFINKTGGPGDSLASAFKIQDFSLDYIHLENITAYLIIENCTFYPNHLEKAITLINCQNVWINSCQIEGVDGNGIEIWDSLNITIQHSSIMNVQSNSIYAHETEKLLIENSTILSGSASGISLSYCSQVTIENSTISQHTFYGLVSEYTDLILSQNNCSYNQEQGFRISSASSALIEQNYIFENAKEGLYIVSSSMINISKNIISHNNMGIYYSNNNNGFIINNQIINSNTDGFQLRSSEYVIVSENNVSKNLGYGIYSLYADHSTFTQNIIKENNNGLYLYYTDYITATKNEVDHNLDVGLVMSYSYYNKFYLNSFSNNVNNEAVELNSYSNTYYLGNFGNLWGDYLEKYPNTSSNGLTYDRSYTVGVGVDYRPLIHLIDPMEANTIQINNDTEIEEWATHGEGTYDNPYYIENYVLNAYLGGNCLDIRNITKHLVIQNCTLLYPYMSGGYGAIYLKDCSNIQIINCSSPNFGVGLYIINTNNSMIIDCSFTGGNYAVYQNGGENITIFHNDFDYNNNGIYAKMMNNTCVYNNSIKNIESTGINVDGNNNNITSNNVAGSGDFGIYLYGGENHIVRSNNVSDAGQSGIYIKAIAYHPIIQENILDNTELQIINTSIDYYQSVVLESSNTRNGQPYYFYYNESELSSEDLINFASIILVNCTDSSLSNMIFHGKTIPLKMLYCKNISITNCIFDFNKEYAFYLYNTNSCLIQNNNISNNFDVGLYLDYSNFNIIHQNQITTNNYRGIEMHFSNQNTIFENDFSENSIVTLSLDNCVGNLVENCNFSNNLGNYAITYSSSNDNIFRNLTIINSNNYAMYGYGSGNQIINNSIYDASVGIGLFSVINDMVCDNHFQNLNDGLVLSSSQDLLISNNIFTTISSKTIRLQSGCSNLTISQNTFEGSVYAGDFAFLEASSIVGNLFINCHYPLRLSSSNNNEILDNWFIGSIDHTIYMINSENNTLINNIFSESTRSSIYLETTQHILIERNILENGTLQSINLLDCVDISIVENNFSHIDSYPIYSSGSSNCNILKNRISTNFCNGIHLINTHTTNISQNYIEYQTEGGIRLESSNNNEISQNFIVNTTYQAIYISGTGNEVFTNYVEDVQDIFSDSGNNLIYDNFYLLVDLDFDGLNGYMEMQLGTDCYLIDTDNDNFLDGYEYLVGTDPCDPFDTPVLGQIQYDELVALIDGKMSLINLTELEEIQVVSEQNAIYLALLDAQLQGNFTEIRFILNQLGYVIGDTDYDGLDDLDEIYYNTSPVCVDTDCDNLNDAFEVKIGTNPLDDDSDDDLWYDGIEITAGTNPLDAADFPSTNAEDDDDSANDPAEIRGNLLKPFLYIGGGVLIIMMVAIPLVIRYQKRK